MNDIHTFINTGGADRHQAYRHQGRHRDRQTYIHTDRQTDRQTGQRDIHTVRQADIRTARQTDIQTEHTER